MTVTVIQKKICLLGEFAVGKTSLVRRFVEGRFDDRYLSTIGVKISRRVVERPTGNMNLLIWDLAGSDEFNGQIQSSYLRGSAGAFIVCDLTRRETLSGFERYIEQIRAVGLSVPTVFLANKLDLTDERVVSDQDLEELSDKFGSPSLLCSAKTGENVERAFLLLAEMIERQEPS